jgi:hypothetical protein
MHGPINVKSPNNISKWQMGFNSAFKGLMGINSEIGVFLDTCQQFSVLLKVYANRDGVHAERNAPNVYQSKQRCK